MCECVWKMQIRWEKVTDVAQYSSVQFYAALCGSVQLCVVPCGSLQLLQFDVVLCGSMWFQQFCVVPCSFVWFHVVSVVLCGSVQFCTVPCSSVWFCAVLCGSMWFCAVLCSSMEFCVQFWAFFLQNASKFIKTFLHICNLVSAFSTHIHTHFIPYFMKFMHCSLNRVPLNPHKCLWNQVKLSNT